MNHKVMILVQALTPLPAPLESPITLILWLPVLLFLLRSYFEEW